MPIVGVLQSPNLTQERYEESIHMLTAADSISSADDFPFDGQLAHVVVQSAAGFRICRRVGVRGSSSLRGGAVDAGPLVVTHASCGERILDFRRSATGSRHLRRSVRIYVGARRRRRDLRFLRLACHCRRCLSTSTPLRAYRLSCRWRLEPAGLASWGTSRGSLGRARWPNRQISIRERVIESPQRPLRAAGFHSRGRAVTQPATSTGSQRLSSARTALN